ncbi:hypothetical protein AAGF08_18880 [Algoriphagus sp. SE2]|uniref:hypothetical protein n=1 Tax=Algoriphagus sp. SE2 TaxID=3141536 RepID=UPI0031CD1401
MNYKVHRLEVSRDNMQEKLEKYLNRLSGDVISIIPNVKPTMMFLGGSAKVDFLLIVEKTK